MFVLATQKIILRHDVFFGDDSNLSEEKKKLQRLTKNQQKNSTKNDGVCNIGND